MLCRELHAVVHDSARDWPGIVAAVRSEIWETGVGLEMFVENGEFWSAIRTESMRLHEHAKYVASVARTDPGHMLNVRLDEALQLPVRPKEERAAYLRQFVEEMQKQLDEHGDERLERSCEAAQGFANSILHDMEAIEEMGGDPIDSLVQSLGVPPEFKHVDMTLGDLGELAAYARQLSILARRLRPPVEVTMSDVPPDALPSHVLMRELASIQMKARRVRGSDLGDGHIASLVFYADAVQVDKRTHEFLRQVGRKNPKLGSLMGRVMPPSDYGQILQLFDA